MGGGVKEMTWRADPLVNKEVASLWREIAKNCSCQKVTRISGSNKSLFLSGKVDSLSAVALTVVGFACHFTRSAHTDTHIHTRTHVRWLFRTACPLYLFNPDQCVVLHQGPVSAPVINMWVSLYQIQLQINQRVGHRRKGANISSITSDRHHGEMQIASQETLGDVKEKLTGRQREANEYNGKCIQGEKPPLFIPINTILSVEVRCRRRAHV